MSNEPRRGHCRQCKVDWYWTRSESPLRVKFLEAHCRDCGDVLTIAEARSSASPKRDGAPVSEGDALHIERQRAVESAFG